ncbi:hypothetical protein Tco_1183290 [Tanacetum coccineum]
MSNSFSALNEEEEEEDVENVYDESANLIQNTKAGGRLPTWQLEVCGVGFKLWGLVRETGDRLEEMATMAPESEKEKKCGMYGVLDDELLSDYYKDLFYKLQVENKK